jgi:protein-S-isoprenylcysteine O-methyltransferase Ste14
MSQQSDHAKVVHPPLIVLSAILIGLLLNWAYPLPIFPHGGSNAAGIAMIILAIFIAISAGVQMRKAHTTPNPYKPTTAIVQGGPYRFTRNPMYLSFCILYSGVALWANSAWSIFLLPVLIGAIMEWVIFREEAYLEGKFGAEYIEYKKRVRRWL